MNRLRRVSAIAGLKLENNKDPVGFIRYLFRTNEIYVCQLRCLVAVLRSTKNLQNSQLLPASHHKIRSRIVPWVPRKHPIHLDLGRRRWHPRLPKLAQSDYRHYETKRNFSLLRRSHRTTGHELYSLFEPAWEISWYGLSKNTMRNASDTKSISFKNLKSNVPHVRLQ